MKLPFVSRKKFEIQVNNNKVLNESRAALREEYIKLQEDAIDLRELNKRLGNELDIQAEKLDIARKELSRIKSLCTKNGIDYKKTKKVK